MALRLHQELVRREAVTRQHPQVVGQQERDGGAVRIVAEHCGGRVAGQLLARGDRPDLVGGVQRAQLAGLGDRDRQRLGTVLVAEAAAGSAAPPRDGRAEVTYFMPRDAEIMLPNDKAGELRLPLFGTRVAAGFPSPADDHLENTLDLNEHLVRRPAATFFVRVQGESMTGAGINPGDILVVDRAEEARDGKIVIAALDGELTVKRLSRRDGRVMLMPENPAFEPIPVNEEMSFVIWGVVRSVIHEF